MLDGTKTKPKILIVEDDYDNQKFLEIFLKKYYDVVTCESEQSFYKCLNDYSFDLIIMDISLKGNKNGLELTKEIKNNPQYKNLPIVCLTAHAFPKDKENAIEAGVDVFLSKPVENFVLINTINDFLKKKFVNNF
ncbi:MAG TPA: response regulator [Ignavibacteriaceae bacterium]|nr:response regulator [Ignavibacteriaceae bacterium]